MHTHTISSDKVYYYRAMSTSDDDDENDEYIVTFSTFYAKCKQNNIFLSFRLFYFNMTLVISFRMTPSGNNLNFQCHSCHNYYY